MPNGLQIGNICKLPSLWNGGKLRPSHMIVLMIGFKDILRIETPDSPVSILNAMKSI